jgi:SOS-response transcriptional repressor LexA
MALALDQPVPAAKKEFHEGKFFKLLVARSGRSQRAVARAMGLPVQTMTRWFRQRRVRIRPHNLITFIRTVGLSEAEFDRQLFAAAGRRLPRSGSISEMLAPEVPVGENGATVADFILDFDRNVEPYSEVQLVEIPLFDLAVAAGGWADVSDVEGAVCNPDQISQSLFRVRISGDSMQPAYKSGDVVEFRCVRVDVDGFEAGADFYVQQSDGTATFKRCEKAGEEIIVLRALNRKKYPRPMEVPRGLIVRAARAVAKVQML